MVGLCNKINNFALLKTIFRYQVSGIYCIIVFETVMPWLFYAWDAISFTTMAAGPVSIHFVCGETRRPAGNCFATPVLVGRDATAAIVVNEMRETAVNAATQLRETKTEQKKIVTRRLTPKETTRQKTIKKVKKKY